MLFLFRQEYILYLKEEIEALSILDLHTLIDFITECTSNPLSFQEETTILFVREVIHVTISNVLKRIGLQPKRKEKRIKL